MTFVRLPKVVDGDNVCMVQPRHRPGLTTETVGKRTIYADLQRQQLDGDETVEGDLPRLVDHPHPSAPKERESLVAWEKPLRLFDTWRLPRIRPTRHPGRLQ